MMTTYNANTVISAAFNGFLLSHVLLALHQAGMLQNLITPPGLSPPSDQRGDVFEAAMTLLGDAQLVNYSAGRYKLTELGIEVVAQHGFFVWAIGGYSDFFTRLGSMLSGDLPALQRNEALVARGSGLIDRALLRDQVAQYILGLGIGYIADLGCGDATRLCDLAMRDGQLKGVGVELSPAAVVLAREQIAQNGLTNRLSVVQGDCLDMIQHPLSQHIDCVLSFFLLHDLLFAKGGRFSLIEDILLTNFPNADIFIFADTARVNEFQSDTYPPPVFIRGFELVHAMMGIPTRTLHQYKEALRSERLKLVEVVDLAVPSSYLFVLRRH
jgi:hypothetical protein